MKELHMIWIRVLLLWISWFGSRFCPRKIALVLLIEVDILLPFQVREELSRPDFKYISGRSWSCIRHNEIDKIRTWSKKYFEPWKGFVKYILNTDKLSSYTVFIILSIRSDIKSVFQTLQGFKTSSWYASFFRKSVEFNVKSMEARSMLVMILSSTS